MPWTSPRTWASGEAVTAALLNTHLRDNLKEIGDPWTAYTPTLGNVTLGNGTLTGHYIEAGKLIHFRIKLTLGSSSAVTGSPTFTLPVAATAARTLSGGLMMNDASGPFKGGFYYNSNATTLALRDDASALLSATNPFTWATDDEIFITGTYEAA